MVSPSITSLLYILRIVIADVRSTEYRHHSTRNEFFELNVVVNHFQPESDVERFSIVVVALYDSNDAK